RGTGSSVLFAMGGPISLTVNGEMRVRYAPGSQTLLADEPITRPLEYTVVSSGIVTEPGGQTQPAAPQPEQESRRFPRLRDLIGGSPAVADNVVPKSQIDPQIETFARRPEVSGTDDEGALAERRPADARTHPLDMQIAANIERYLQRNFEYTLDLTDTRRLDGQDPLVGFLYQFQRGHCEYFAGAMALMCQSLGMQARVVIGFKTDEFNEFDNRFMVRQSHAHAWVEVLRPDGVWQTFDPTSGND